MSAAQVGIYQVLGRNSVGRNLARVDKQLNKSAQSATVANKPTGSWAESTTALPAPIKMSLSCSTQHLPDYTWNGEFSFCPCYAKNRWAAGEGPEKGNKDDPRAQSLPREERLRELGLLSL